MDISGSKFLSSFLTPWASASNSRLTRSKSSSLPLDTKGIMPRSSTASRIISQWSLQMRTVALLFINFHAGFHHIPVIANNSNDGPHHPLGHTKLLRHVFNLLGLFSSNLTWVRLPALTR